MARQPLQISVRRSALLEDANKALAGIGADIRRPLRVSFISEHGYEEAGVDQGGLTKEFLGEARSPPPVASAEPQNCGAEFAGSHARPIGHDSQSFTCRSQTRLCSCEHSMMLDAVPVPPASLSITHAC